MLFWTSAALSSCFAAGPLRSSSFGRRALLRRFCRDGTGCSGFAGAQAFSIQTGETGGALTRPAVSLTPCPRAGEGTDREVEPAGHHRQPAGGNGAVAAQTIKSAGSDGYTLLVTDGRCSPSIRRFTASSNTTTRRISYRSRPWARRRCLTIHPSVLLANTLAEFIAYVKANPAGELRHLGHWQHHHLTGESFSAALGINMVHAVKGMGRPRPRWWAARCR